MLVTSNPNIPQDTKVQIVNEITQAVGAQTGIQAPASTTTAQVSQSNVSAPIVGDVTSTTSDATDYDFEPTVSIINGSDYSIMIPDGVTGATMSVTTPNGEISAHNIKLVAGTQINNSAGLAYRREHDWTITGTYNGQVYVKSGSFVWPEGSTVCAFASCNTN